MEDEKLGDDDHLPAAHRSQPASQASLGCCVRENGFRVRVPEYGYVVNNPGASSL